MMDRGQRIVQSFAGPYAELIIAGAASLVAWAFPDWGHRAGPVQVRASLNYFVIFLNLVPLLELDGYWILSDLIQVPDLRPRSLQFIRYDLWRSSGAASGSRSRRSASALYGDPRASRSRSSRSTWSYFFWERCSAGSSRAVGGGR